MKRRPCLPTNLRANVATVESGDTRLQTAMRRREKQVEEEVEDQGNAVDPPNPVCLSTIVPSHTAMDLES